MEFQPALIRAWSFASDSLAHRWSKYSAAVISPRSCLSYAASNWKVLAISAADRVESCMVLPQPETGAQVVELLCGREFAAFVPVIRFVELDGPGYLSRWQGRNHLPFAEGTMEVDINEYAAEIEQQSLRLISRPH